MVSDPGGAALVAAAAFVATNVDDLLVTSGQVAAAKPGRVRRVAYGRLFAGVVVVAVSAAMAAVLFGVPVRLVGLLGLVPVALGLRDLARLRSSERRAGRVRRTSGRGLVAALLLAVAMSGDNFAVYIPIFRVGDRTDRVVTGAVLVAGEVLLVLAALLVGRRPRLRAALDRAGAYAAPVLYVAIGVVVVWRAGTFAGL